MCTLILVCDLDPGMRTFHFSTLPLHYKQPVDAASVLFLFTLAQIVQPYQIIPSIFCSLIQPNLKGRRFSLVENLKDKTKGQDLQDNQAFHYYHYHGLISEYDVDCFHTC